MSKPSNNIITKVESGIRKASVRFGVKPYEVSSSQFWLCADNIKEWEIRKVGGFGNLQEALFPIPVVGPQKSETSKKFKKRPVFPKLENFTVHKDEIAKLFKLAGLKQHQVFRIVVQPDTHTPEHDKPAVNAFCEFNSYYKPHGIINLGDFLENESVSHWEPKTAKPRRLVPEVKVGREVLSQIDDSLGKQCFYKKFLIGNHEYWFQEYLNVRSPEIEDGLDELDGGTHKLTLQKLLALDQFGYEVVPFNEILNVGDANFLHGYYTCDSHAKKHLQVIGGNVYYGHLHDCQSYSSVSIKGVHEAMSFGCLRTLNASFLRGKPNNWSHAFGVFEFRSDGSYTRYAPIIVNGKLSFNGKVFGG